MIINDELSKFETVFIDTAPIIYYIEDHNKFGPLSKNVIDMLKKKSLKGFTSVLTLTEVLAKPIELNRNDLVDKFLKFLKFNKNISLIDISTEIAERAGQLRGHYPSIKTLDSIQLSVAINLGIDIFLTNDKQLKKVTEINVIVLKDYLD